FNFGYYISIYFVPYLHFRKCLINIFCFTSLFVWLSFILHRTIPKDLNLLGRILILRTIIPISSPSESYQLSLHIEEDIEEITHRHHHHILLTDRAIYTHLQADFLVAIF